MGLALVGALYPPCTRREILSYSLILLQHNLALGRSTGTMCKEQYRQAVDAGASTVMAPEEYSVASKHRCRERFIELAE